MSKLPKCKECAGKGRIRVWQGEVEVVMWCKPCNGSGVKPATLDDLYDVLVEIKEILALG